MTNSDRPKFATNEKPSGLHKNLPYRSKKKLLSAGELRFYREGLAPAVGNQFQIMVKVRLTDLLSVPARQWEAPAGRRISQRHVDFVLVSRRDFSIQAVVELDDKSHLQKSQQVKDAYLGDALQAAGIVLIRFPIYGRYNSNLIGEIITGVLKRHGASFSSIRRRRSGTKRRQGSCSGWSGSRRDDGSTSCKRPIRCRRSATKLALP